MAKIKQCTNFTAVLNEVFMKFRKPGTDKMFGNQGRLSKRLAFLIIPIRSKFYMFLSF